MADQAMRPANRAEPPVLKEGATRQGGGASIKSTMPTAMLAALDDLAIQRAKTGDLEALEQIYRAYEGLVYSLARRLCRTAEDAEDALQDTFLEVCRSIRSFRGSEPGMLTAWVKRVAASKALMRLRRERYREADELQEDLVEVVGAARTDVALQMDLETALGRLPERSRTVVWLHDVEGYTHEDIAELMGMTVSFSKSQLARAHARLRAWLGKETRW